MCGIPVGPPGVSRSDPANSVGPLRADDLAALARRRWSARVRTMDGGPRALVVARRAIPTWTWLGGVPFQRWIARLPANHEWRQAHDRLRSETASIPWESRGSQDKAVSVGLRVLIASGYSALEEITDDDLAQIPSGTRGQDGLDVALCRLGILARTPQRGTSRRSRRPRRSVAELVAMSDVPAPFRAITSLYLETYATRISQV